MLTVFLYIHVLLQYKWGFPVLKLLFFTFDIVDTYLNDSEVHILSADLESAISLRQLTSKIYLHDLEKSVLLCFVFFGFGLVFGPFCFSYLVCLFFWSFFVCFVCVVGWFNLCEFNFTWLCWTHTCSHYSHD